MKVRVHFFLHKFEVWNVYFTLMRIYTSKIPFWDLQVRIEKKSTFLGVQKFIPNLGQLIFKRGYIFLNSNIVWYVVFYRQNKMASSNYQKKDGHKVLILGRPRIGTLFFFLSLHFVFMTLKKKQYQFWDKKFSTNFGTIFFHLIIILLMGIDFLLYNKHINVKTTSISCIFKKI